MAEQEQVTILALLKDAFTGTLGKIRAGLQGLLGIFSKLGSIATAPFRLLGSSISGIASSLLSLRGLLIGSAFAGVIKTFTDFEGAMAKVSTNLDTTKVSLRGLSDGLIDIAIKTGESFDSLTKGLYDTVSSGVEAGQALTFLDAAARLAVGGSSNTADAIDGLTTILNSYGLSASKAREITDSLFKAAEFGKTEISELTSSIGQIAKSASLVGLTVDELTGSLGALTRGGLKTRNAVNALSALMSGILAPTAEATEAANEFGITLSSEQLRSKGFLEFLREVSAATGDVDVNIKRLFPNVNAFRAAAILSGQSAATFAEQMDLMANKTGATDKAFGKLADTLGFKIRQIGLLFSALFVQIGEAAKPVLTEIIGDEAAGTGLQGLLRSIYDSKERVTVVVRAFVELIQRLYKVIIEVFKNSDFVALAINIVASVQTAVAKTFVASLPLLLSTVNYIGKQLAIGFVKTLIGSTNAEIAKALTQGGFFSKFFKTSLASFGLGTEEAERLQALGEQLNTADATIKGAVEGIRQTLQVGSAGAKTFINAVGEVVSIQVDTLEDARRLLAEDPSLNRLDLSKTLFPDFERTLADAQAKRQRILEALTGDSDAISLAFEEVQRDVGSNIEGFINKTGAILSESVATLTNGLKEPTAKAISELMNFVSAEIPQRFNEAKIKDEAAKAAKAAVSAAESEVPSQATEPEDVPAEESSAFLDSLSAGIKDVIGQFDDLRAVGNAVGQQIASGFTGLIDVFFGVNASFSEFARNFLIQIAKMILQIAIFRSLSGLFAGAATPAPEVAVPGGLRLGTDSVKRFAGGTSFVPGPASARRDMVPALLVPGEGVIQKDSVAYYSRAFIRAINQRLIPKQQAKGLLRAVTAGAPNALKSAFASGGFVSPAAAGRGPVASGTVLALDEDTAETFMSGSRVRSAFLRMVQADKASIISALGLNARGIK
jgi:TP901 family phage tail tape measure protein